MPEVRHIIALKISGVVARVIKTFIYISYDLFLFQVKLRKAMDRTIKILCDVTQKVRSLAVTVEDAHQVVLQTHITYFTLSRFYHLRFVSEFQKER